VFAIVFEHANQSGFRIDLLFGLILLLAGLAALFRMIHMLVAVERVLSVFRPVGFLEIVRIFLGNHSLRLSCFVFGFGG